MKQFFLCISAVSVLQLSCLYAQQDKMAQENKQEMSRKHHMHKGWHRPKHHPHDGDMRRRGPKRPDMIFEHLNKEQQAVYTEMHNLQRNIRKNMQALGQERRNIKNLTTGDARKKAQENINKICNEIKSNLEEHQPRITDAIGELK